MERRKPAAAGYQLPVKKKEEVKKPVEKTITKLYEDSEYDDSASIKKQKNKASKPKKVDHSKPKRTHKSNKLGLKIFLIILLIAAIVTTLYLIFRPSITENNLGKTEQKIANAEEIYYSRLTGREVPDLKTVNQAATCVMIENSPDARPQSGLDKAGVVYEAIAEGGITRFMAIYQEDKPQYVGPVRSVRMTYAQFAKPYHCSIAHVGGSNNALNLIRNNTEFRDIDQFFNDAYYWRSNDRYAPHNVYTSFSNLDRLNANLGYETSDFNGFARIKPDTHIEDGSSALTIRITLSSATYNPIFIYNFADNKYYRSHTEDGAHMSIDKEGNETQISPDVVVAIKVNAISRDGSVEGYLDYQTTGTNDAYVFQNGNVTPGKWERSDEDSELKFYDETGTEILLNRGQTWITAYPAGSGAISWE